MSSIAKNTTLKLLAVGMENAAKWQLDGLKPKAVGHKSRSFSASALPVWHRVLVLRYEHVG